MNRLDIIRAVARVLTTKGEAAKAVETTFETIRQALREGEIGRASCRERV